MLDVCSAELSYEPVGLLFGITEPSGTIADGAFESMRDELLARLRAAMAEDGGVDAVALELHGAGVAESYEDVEGALAKAVRSVVGPDVPIVGAFDLHGNISAECAAVFDFMTVTWYYPHTDCYERGQEAVRMLPRLLGLGSPGSSGEGDRCGGAVGTKSIETMGAATVEKMRTFTHLERVPTLLPLCMMCTQEGFPAASLHDLCQDLERAHAAAGVLDCSVFHGFPYADIAIAGTTVIVTTDDDAAASRALAGEVAREVAGWIWAHKERFRSDACSADAAIATARRRATELGGMVCVNETADNTGCGAPGDATHLLRAMLRSDAAEPFAPGEAAFGWMYDASTLSRAVAAGEGATIDSVSLGGLLDADVAGAPIVARDVLVVALTDGRFDATPGSAYGGGRRSLGTMARLRIGNVDVLVNAVREQAFDEGAFTLAGIDVRSCRVVGIKSSTHFRAGWRSLAADIITADDPGLSSNQLDVFEPLRTRKLGYWPTNPDATYAQTHMDFDRGPGGGGGRGGGGREGDREGDREVNARL
jgi:toxic protein SymE